MAGIVDCGVVPWHGVTENNSKMDVLEVSDNNSFLNYKTYIYISVYILVHHAEYFLLLD
jgi:hypothetical protein